MKISCIGAGYVGFSLSVLLSKYNPVKIYDIDKDKIKLINSNKCPFIDEEINQFIKKNKLNIKALNKIKLTVQSANYIIIATPTDYDPKTNAFDTSSVEISIENILKFNKKASIIIKSTIPLGYTDYLKKNILTKKSFFLQSFLERGNL